MEAITLTEHFQLARIKRSPVLTCFMQLDKKLFKSKVPKINLCTHNLWYKTPYEPDSEKSVQAVGAAPHYIYMNILKLLRVTSKNWNNTSSEGGEHPNLNLMQRVFALDHELAMARKSITGAV